MGSSRLIIIFLFFAVPGAWAKKSMLKTLITKQEVRNLRFANHNGTFTYYQRRSGNLVLSTNYKVHDVLKKAEKTQYSVIATTARKRVLIQSNENYYNYFSLVSEKEIFVTKYGGHEVTEIGSGVAPALHVDDSWISYYKPGVKTIYFKKIENSALNFEVKINAYIDPYFVPQVIMPDNENVLYTDTTKDGLTAVFHLNRKKQFNRLFLQSDSVESKLDMCIHFDDIVIFNRGVNHSSNSSIITKYSPVDYDASKGEILYESKKNEVGSLICNHETKKLYFIKNTSDIPGIFRSEVVSFDPAEDPKNRNLKIESDLNYVSALINMDGRLLIPYRGKYYVLLGGETLKTDSIKVESTEGKVGTGKEKKKEDPKKGGKKKGKSKKGKKKR